MPKCELCRYDVDQEAIRQRAPRVLSALAPTDGGARAHVLCETARGAVASDDPPGAADRPRWWICDVCMERCFVPHSDESPPLLDELHFPDAAPAKPRPLPKYPEIAEVRRLLGRTQRTQRRVLVFQGLFLYAAALMASVSAAIGLEVLFGLPPAARFAAAVCVAAAAGGGFLFLIVRRLFSRPSDEETALLVERAFPQIDSGLINAVRFADDPSVPSPVLARAAMGEALERMEGLDPTAAVERRGLRRSAWAAGLLLLASAMMGAALRERAWNAAQRLGAPGRDIERVGAVRIARVTPGDLLGESALLSGDPLAIEAEIEPTDRQDLDAWLSLREGDKEIRRLRLRMAGDALFQGEVRDVRGPVQYRVHVADSSTRFFRVEVVEPPRIASLDVEYRYPAYTGLPPSTEEDTDGTVRAVVGTRFILRLRADRPLRSAKMVLGRRREEIEMRLLGDGLFAETPEPLLIESDQTYFLRIEDERGVAERHPIHRRIRALPNAPPRVVVAAPGRDLTAAPGDVLPIAVRATDDYGMTRAALVARIRREGSEGEWEEVHAWPSVPEGQRIVLSHDWKFSAGDYRPGDVVRYYVWVEDNNDVTGPGVGRSSEYEVRVEAPEQVEAERLGAYRTWQERLQRLLEDQTRLREETRALEEQLGIEPEAPPDEAP